MAAENPERIAAVWARFIKDDKEAFAEIYNTFVDDLFRYGTKISQDDEMVKDAIQEVFIDLYINRKKDKEFAAGLKFYLILALKRNLIRKLQRTRKNENRFIMEASLFEVQYSFEEQLISEESYIEVNQKVQLAIAQLPPKQKEAIYLHYNQSLKYDQIASILNISVESARKQVYRAVKSIRDCLGEKGLILFSLLNRKSKFMKKPG